MRAPLLPSVSWRRTALVGLLLLLTLGAGALSARAVDRQEQLRFDNEAARLDAALTERFTAYVQVLRGAVGLFRASDRVTRADWDTYVRSLRLGERYPGFKSLSFAQAVADGGLGRFEQEVRAERLPKGLGPADALADYTVRAPAGAAGRPSVHGVIRYVAPFNEANRRVLGIDMMAEPTRREVMLRAARTGKAVASPRLRLAGSLDDEAGFIVYVPVRAQGRLVGWVTAAFLAESFAQGLGAARGTSLAVELTDGPGGTGEVLFSSAGTAADGAPLPLTGVADASYSSISSVKVPGGAWSVHHVARPGFTPLSGRLLPWLVVLVGLVITLGLWALARGRARWHAQAVLLEDQAVVLADARDAAERATRATEAFLATMSHEIRTPLNAVIGGAGLLQGTDLDLEQRETARVIASSGDHLLHVINGILDFSKLEAGGVELEEAVFDPGACARSAVDLLAVEASRRSQVLRVELDLPAHVRGDEARLRQVLLNLLANAVRFTPDGGTVVLRGRDAPGDRLTFEVQDTGIGIRPEQRERLFQPFVQASAATTRTHGGTGLGLSIAQRLVTAMGGGIEVESEPGAGATFRFDVLAPAASPPDDPSPGAPIAGAAEDSASMQVLVAEDDEANQMLVQLMLRRLGHVVTVVGDGAAAVEACRGTPYDVVFLDLHMPVLDGVAAAREIGLVRPGADRPYLVAMTGSVAPRDLEAAIAAGVDDVVTKPFVAGDLAAALLRASLRLRA